MDRKTHCPNCFKEPAPAPKCQHCDFDANSYSEAADLLPLFTLLKGGDFVVGRVLSEAGGFSILYAGLQRSLGRNVVIKEFFPHKSSNALAERLNGGITVSARPRYKTEFSVWKKRFFREASLLSECKHDCIVWAIDVFEENDTAYLVMERLNGCTLSEYLGGLHPIKNGLKAGHSLPPDAVLSLLQAALDALEVLHGHNPAVIHCDLTPNNLFLVNQKLEQLKVLDFGLARLGERPPGAATITTKVGTPNFASPEQMEIAPYANAGITPRTDFYTLGASLYTALFGVAPPTAEQRHTGMPLKSLSSLAGVDPTLAAIVQGCLAMDPSQRPRDVAEISRRLAARTVLPPVELKSVTLPEPTPQPVTPIQPVISPSTTEPAPKSKVRKSKPKPNKPEVEPKILSQAPQPKWRYRKLLIAILTAGSFGSVGILLINQAEKFSPANPTADVSPAPSTQKPTHPPPSDIEKPTVAPAGESASPEENPSPPESPVAGVSSASSNEVPNSISPNEIPKHTFSIFSENYLKKKEEFYSKNTDELDAWPFYKKEVAGDSIIKAVLGSWSQESLDGLDISSEKAQHLAQQALPEIRRLADQGDLHAQLQLGILYGKGLGVAKDEKQAVEWYEKAAKQGYVVAQNELGIIYKDGLFVTKDEKQAIEWFHKAAEQGYAWAQNNLGNMYADGLGVTKDYEKAIEWYRKAAEQGITMAQFHLAQMYRRGYGVPKNNMQAIEWYRKAAEQGFAPAQYRVANRELYIRPFT